MKAPVPLLLMNYDLRFGGTERQLVEVARQLDRRRFAPHVGCIRLQGGRRGELERAGIPLVEFSFSSFASAGILRAAGQLRTYLRRHRIQMLHTFDVPATLFAAPVGCLSRIPVVLSSQRAFRELTPGWNHRLLRVVDRMVDGVVVNSAKLREHLREHDGLSFEKTQLIYNSVDLERFSAPPQRSASPQRSAPLAILPDCSPLVGSTAMLRPEKGVADLVEAFAQVAGRSRAGLVLVGGGPLYEPLKARVRELGLADRCHFAGGVTDVLPWLQRMDIFVLPSLSEALSNSVLEAMAAGCAVIASRVGGNPELVHDGETGLLFDPGQVAPLAEQLDRMIQDPAQRRVWAAAGQAFVRTHFSRAKTLEALERYYQQQLERGGVR